MLHPSDALLRTGLIPSVWCPGCGIGTVVNTFIQAVERLKVDFSEVSVVSGIGCTGKINDYLRCNVSQVLDGKVLEFAADLKLKKPDSKIVVFLNNADLLVSGIKDFFDIGKRRANRKSRYPAAG
jgi:2-oxoglutarate ferredoxin oxidoreductase subunit beta